MGELSYTLVLTVQYGASLIPSFHMVYDNIQPTSQALWLHWLRKYGLRYKFPNMTLRKFRTICCGNRTICCGNPTICCGNRTICWGNRTICCGNAQDKLRTPNRTICCGNRTICCGNRTISCGNSFKNGKWTWLAGTNCIFIWLEARDEGGPLIDLI